MKILILVVVWFVITILAFSVPQFIAPTASGFTRGMNRLPIIMALHCLAFLIALFTAGLGYRSRAEIKIWLLTVGFIPLGLDLLLFALVIIVVLGAIVTA